MFLKYLNYLIRSKTKYSIHSPFVYDLATQVLEDNRDFYAFEAVESLRRKLLNSQKEISVVDFGAGSRVNNSRTKKVSDIARGSAKNRKYGKLLFRIVNHFQPENMIELGTSLGISASYQGLAMKNAKFVTLEGCPETASEAQANLKDIKLDHVEVTIGSFDVTLHDTLKKFERLDYAFFDGNHQREPTLSYFEQCAALASNDSVFVIDDIHWSGEMEEAWEIIKNHSKVTATVDLFFLGLVFFRTGQAKEHFVIRY